VGLSAQSVSNALHNPDRVAPATRERIVAAVAELGYRPNRAARTLRKRSSRLIGVRVEPSRDDRAALLRDQFLHALSAGAASAGWHLILCHADGPGSEVTAYRELLDTTAVDAFVLTGTHRDDERTAALREWGVPFASFGRTWDADPVDPDAPWVDVDGREGLRLATAHLVALGHRHVAHLGWPHDSDVGRDRRGGWLEACVAAGLEPGPDAGCEDDAEEARSSAHRLLDDARGGGRPTALTCASDTLALGAMRALAERGLRPGVDVAVTGFDNSPTAALVTPGLTSLRQPVRRVAQELVRMVTTLVAGEVLPARHVLLLPELVVRGSSLPAPPVSHLTGVRTGGPADPPQEDR
jgi:LacI family transcriptional regulator